MSLKASDLIESARDHGFSGSRLQVTDKMMLRALARAERSIFSEVVNLNEEALASTVEFDADDITDSLDNGVGLTVGEHYLIIDGTVRYDNYPTDPDSPLFIVPARMKEEMVEFYPAAYILGSDLYLIRRFPAYSQNDEWEDATTLTIRYVPKPDAVARLVDTVTLPDIAEDFLVMYLAEFMLRQLGELDEGVIAQHQQARESLIQSLANRDSTTTWRVRDVG